jgi:hypothetical protein
MATIGLIDGEDALDLTPISSAELTTCCRSPSPRAA